MFLTHMQSDDDHRDPIFMLKNLYILDQAVEERTALDAIASYSHTEFFTFKTGANIESRNYLNQLHLFANWLPPTSFI